MFLCSSASDYVHGTVIAVDPRLSNVAAKAQEWLPLLPGTDGALAGAILTAVGIWGSTKVLAIVFSDFSRYNLIYGSLAGVMTFLFFVYVVALILLFGAEFAYAWSQPPEPPIWLFWLPQLPQSWNGSTKPLLSASVHGTPS